MACYAVIDTNVIVSALLSDKEDAATVQVLDRVIAGIVVPLYSEGIMREYQEVLRREKFHFPEEMTEYLISSIKKFGILTEPLPTNIQLPDMKDVQFYDLLARKRAEGACLVTGNLRHFPSEPDILTARQLIDMLDEKYLRQQC